MKKAQLVASEEAANAGAQDAAGDTQQQESTAQPSGPAFLSPPLAEQRPPLEELQQRPPAPSAHAADAVVCLEPQPDLGELNDTGLTSERAAELRAVFGPNAVKPKQIPEWKKVVERYLRLTPVLLTTAAILSASIEVDGKRDWLSFGLLLFLCNVMVWADYLGERSASNAIKAVERLAAPECSSKRDGEWASIKVMDLVPGDVVWLKAGMVVPADGAFIPHQKCLLVDESSLTGESLAVKKFRGSELLSGSVVQRGEGSMMVLRTGAQSFYGKTIALLARADRKGHLRSILDATSKTLTLAAAVIALFLFFWEMFFPAWAETCKEHSHVGLLFKRAFTLIASVIPAAMPVVTTTVLAVGAVSISKEHAVVSRLSAIEEAAGVKILCTDKTGTLTVNVLTLSREELSVEEGFTAEELLVYASLASTLTDPEAIDVAINAAVNMKAREAFEVLDYTPFNPVDKRADSVVRDSSGCITLVTKGAPHVIRDLVCSPGDTDMQSRLKKLIEEKARKGLRSLGVAIKPLRPLETQALEEATATLGDSGWKLVGYISLFDPPRADTKETLERSKRMGVDVKMLTGDQQAIAAETARLLGMGDNISGPEIFKERPKGLEADAAFCEFIRCVDGFSGVYPEHKFDIVDALQQGGCLVAMTGDGVNDAPALKRATVGIAVSGATEAARAAADIVLLSPGLSSIITVFSLSRQIFKRIEAYITFRIHSSTMTLLFWWGCVVIFNYEFPTWVLVLIAIINDFVLMSCSRDNVPSSSKPLIWSMLFVSSIAFVTSFIMAACMLLYIYLSDPAYGVNWWEAFGLEKFQGSPARGRTPISLQTSAGVWLLFTLCVQLSFHTCRTHYVAFLYSKDNLFPSIVVLIPQISASLLTLFLSVYWRYDWQIASGPRMIGLPWAHAGVTILWALLWFVVADLCKLAYCRLLWPHVAPLDANFKKGSGNVPKDEQQYRGKVRVALKHMEDYRRKRAQTWKSRRELTLEALQQQKPQVKRCIHERASMEEGSPRKSTRTLSTRRITKKSQQPGGASLKRQGFGSSSLQR
ncbi:hypothetical protein Esti_001795 [Eimeria stiedai]